MFKVSYEDSYLNHEDREDEETDAVEHQTWVYSVGLTFCDQDRHMILTLTDLILKVLL